MPENNNQNKAFTDFAIQVYKHTGNRPIIRNGYNKHRSKIIQTENKKLLLIYKRAYYKTFATDKEKYKPFCEKYSITCVGESINVCVIEKCIKEKVDLIVLIHDDEIYCVNPKLIKRYCELHKLKCRDKKANIYQEHRNDYHIEHELKYSFPIELIDKLEWWMIE